MNFLLCWNLNFCLLTEVMKWILKLFCTWTLWVGCCYGKTYIYILKKHLHRCNSKFFKKECSYSTHKWDLYNVWCRVDNIHALKYKFNTFCCFVFSAPSEVSIRLSILGFPVWSPKKPAKFLHDYWSQTMQIGHLSLTSESSKEVVSHLWRNWVVNWLDNLNTYQELTTAVKTGIKTQ